MNDKPKIDWMQTYSGIAFYPTDPRIEDINIEDIAHALSRLCRFGGHVKDFYSVAQHSVLVSHEVHEDNAYDGLMHDTAEGYLCDIPRALKRQIHDYKGYEDNLMHLIAKKYGFNWPMPENVKQIDNRILLDERKWLLNNGPTWDMDNYYRPLGIKIKPWSIKKSKKQFLKRFEELNYGR